MTPTAGTQPGSRQGRKRSRRQAGCFAPLAIGLSLGVAVPVLLLVWAQGADTVGPAPLVVAYAALPWLLPLAAVVVIGLAFVARAPLTWLAALALIGTYAWRYGHVWWPRQAVEAAGGLHLRVMAFNIGDQRMTADEVIERVRAENPDLISIEELNPFTAAALNQGLADQWPHQAMDFNAPSTGLFSRYPLSSAEFVPTEGNRPYLRADVDLNGVMSHVFAMHPSAPDVVFRRNVPIGINDQRPRAQLVPTAELVRTLTGPRLMLGDFNMSDQSPGYAQVTRGLHDSFAEAGFGHGFTWPVAQSRNTLKRWSWGPPFPLVRIDYILHSDEFAAVAAHVDCGSNSDHCYLVADLVLK